MTTNAINMLILLVVYLCSSTRDIDANPIASNNVSLLDELKKSNDVCKAGSPFYDSNNAKMCNLVKYPSDNATIDPNDSQLLLCFGLYDRIIRLCHLDSLKKTEKSTLPTEASQFDAEVEKNMPKDETDIYNFCEKWSNEYPPIYPKIRPYVSQFDKKMEKHISCLKICTDEQEKFVPLCSALAKMDKLSKLTGVTFDEPSEKPANSQKEAPKSQSQSVQPINAAVDTNFEVAAKPVGNTDLPSNAKTPKTSPKGSDAGQNLSQQQAAGNKNISQGLSSPAIKPNQPEAGSIKKDDNSGPETNAAAPASTDTEKVAANNEPQEKVTSEDKENTEKEPQINKNDLNNNGQDTAVPAPPASDVPENPGTSGEEISDATGAVLEDPKTEVISEHTQEDPDDQFQDADPIEAIDSLLPEEDPDRNSLQPSEKRGYSPRMPSLPNEDDSHFFGYFTVIGVICIAGYVGYHNKQKILAMVLEGRRARGGRSRRRPSTANYRKLDCTLEEAVTSQCNSNPNKARRSTAVSSASSYTAQETGSSLLKVRDCYNFDSQ